MYQEEETEQSIAVFASESNMNACPTPQRQGGIYYCLSISNLTDKITVPTLIQSDLVCNSASGTCLYSESQIDLRSARCSTEQKSEPVVAAIAWQVQCSL